MKKSLVFAMMIAACAISSAAQAEETAKAQDATPAAEKKICRTERVTGSLAARKRICLTQAEWDQLAEQAAKGINTYQRGASATPQAPSGGLGN